MNKVYIIFSCLIAAVGIHADQLNGDAIIVNIYNNLRFFDSFLSRGEIDGLQYSAEDIPPETIRTIRSIELSYTFIYNEMIRWCSEVETIFDEPVPNIRLLEDRNRFVSNVYRRINDMKTNLDSIAMKRTPNMNTKKENQPSHSEQGSQDDNPQTLEDKLNYAKSLIDKAFEVIFTIYNNENTSFNKTESVANCKPVLEKLKTELANPPQYKLPPQTVIPSKGDTLKNYSRNCGFKEFLNESTVCEAVLSKSTMKRFVKVYLLEKPIIDFFDAIDFVNSTKQCKDEMKSIIPNFSLYWKYEVPKMHNNQFLNISACLINDIKDVQVTIVNQKWITD